MNNLIALLEDLRKKALVEKRALEGWIKAVAVSESDVRLLLTYDRDVIFAFMTRQIPVRESLLNAMKQNVGLLCYWEASANIVKSLSESDFKLLIEQRDSCIDDYGEPEKTTLYAYLVLRYSITNAEINYIERLGWMKNNARIRSQSYGGKLYKMAAPYLYQFQKEEAA